MHFRRRKCSNCCICEVKIVLSGVGEETVKPRRAAACCRHLNVVNHSFGYGLRNAQTKPPSEREGDRLRWKEPAVHRKLHFLNFIVTHFPQSLRDSVSLRLGHTAAFTAPRAVIHYRVAASLPDLGEGKS